MDTTKELMAQYGIRSALPEDPVVAMAYVPYQQRGKMYYAEQGLEKGTLFPELNKPFRCGKGGNS